MAFDKCETCRGRKEIMGIGGMKKKCHVCSGVGYVSINEKEEEKEVVVEKRAYKRKKKVDLDVLLSEEVEL